MNISRRFEKIYVCVLLAAAFVLRLLAAKADPFLHPWDERFHALVSRNLMHHPFQPMLRAFPITENYDRFTWCCNHIWLHKQPLFMWQMAMSMKVFGVSELAMRLPSVIMGVLLVLLLYRITKLFTNSSAIALITATMLAFSNFHLQMIAGLKGMDHNDVAHGFYVLASIWAYAEYSKKPKWYWVVLIGLFAGCAILNKWLTGLLVFLGWGAHLLVFFKKGDFKKELPWFALALVICVMVFLPWQMYILHTYPDLAQYEYEFNRRHITEALEGHEGPTSYYWDRFMGFLFLFLIGALFSLFRKNDYRRSLGFAFILEIVFVFCFFSFIVKTKVDTYLFFVMPLCFIFIGILLHGLMQRLRRKWVSVLLLAATAILVLEPGQIWNYLSSGNKERNERIYNANIYRNLKEYIPEDVKVVMNMNSFEDVDVMFYNNDITAYHWTLPEEDFKQFEKRKIPIAVFKPHGNYDLPPWVVNYPYLHIIDVALYNF